MLRKKDFSFAGNRVKSYETMSRNRAKQSRTTEVDTSFGVTFAH